MFPAFAAVPIFWAERVACFDCLLFEASWSTPLNGGADLLLWLIR